MCSGPRVLGYQKVFVFSEWLESRVQMNKISEGGYVKHSMWLWILMCSKFKNVHWIRTAVAVNIVDDSERDKLILVWQGTLYTIKKRHCYISLLEFTKM